jgi:hypothetical protein
MPEVQPSLRRYRSEGSKIIQEFDTLSGSTQANESFHAVKGKYIDKRLNFTTSTEARFPSGAISQSRSPGWPDGGANPWTFLYSQHNAERCFGTWNQDTNEKIRKGEENPKEERKTRPKMSGQQGPSGTAKERTTTISGNDTELMQTKLTKNNTISHQKTRHCREMVSRFPSANIYAGRRHF